MDLHLTGDQATAEEKAAADQIPGSSRDLLLPILHAAQARMGWISHGAINYIAQKLDTAPAEVHGVASFYGMFSLEPRPPVVAHVCNDIACMLKPPPSLKLGRDTLIQPSPCLGLCERAPAALITTAGENPREEVVAPTVNSVPQAGQPQLRLLRRIGQIDPTDINDYRRTGGFEALRTARELGPEGVLKELLASRLLGRGGAAFPTGKKSEALHMQIPAGKTHYLVCNADESEPGTFKDRVIMEGDPFSVIEGMMIVALAAGARKGYIYIRGEYPLAFLTLQRAIDTARAHGILDGQFDIALRRGAGAYICGEETALFNSIEGYRGEPRNKPPFPTQAGLFREPTVVNNVETLINVPEIIRMGGAEYAKIGTAQSAGYRLFCLSGHAVRPGVYEVAFGITLRELIELAGGVGGNGQLQAVLLGGAAGAFVTPQELDTPLTFEGTRAIGATLGSGVVMLFDTTVDLKRILLRIAEFMRDESCGQCVPCRVGTIRQEETLHRLIEGHPLNGDLQLLREMGQAMRDASICGLGQTASSALESALNRWSLFS